MTEKEIKFRQENLGTRGKKTWHYWGFIDGGFISPLVSIAGGKSYQYIGLHDKNDKEVYEENIVKKDNYQGVVKYFINPDKFGAFTACYVVELNKEESISLDESFEIIGDTYNNPELIK